MAKPPRNLGTFEEHLRRDVCRMLLWDDRIGSSDIDVIVQKDTVTLTGSVETAAARARAEELARKIPGVGFVRNLLAVKEPVTAG